MPVAKKKTTQPKKTPAKKKSTVKEKDTNTIKTAIRVNYPDASSIVTYFSNIPVDDFTNGYAEARLKDGVLKITIGAQGDGKPAYYQISVVNFVSMLIPAKYIQSIQAIQGYKDEG